MQVTSDNFFHISPNLSSKEWDLMIDEVHPGIFQIPCFTKNTCSKLIELADKSQLTVGRHQIAPTIDILLRDLSTDLYEEYVEFLKKYIHPMALYCLSFVPGTICQDNFKDHTFIAKYTPETQGHLKLHSDGDHVMYTINILLSENFEGGGTFFVGDQKFHGKLVHPNPGDLLMHPGNRKYQHGSRPVTSGSRYILVSFITF